MKLSFDMPFWQKYLVTLSAIFIPPFLSLCFVFIAKAILILFFGHGVFPLLVFILLCIVCLVGSIMIFVKVMGMIWKDIWL